jgi:hypothetical protein
MHIKYWIRVYIQKKNALCGAKTKKRIQSVCKKHAQMFFKTSIDKTNGNTPIEGDIRK